LFLNKRQTKKQTKTKLRKNNDGTKHKKLTKRKTGQQITKT